jgi:hypothetical protein
MSPAPPPDIVRPTLIAVLKQLNQAESQHEGRSEEQALELKEIEEKLSDFAPVQQKKVNVSLAVGLLLRNRLVAAPSAKEYSWQRGRSVAQRYRITAEGKKFLIDSIESSDRVS